MFQSRINHLSAWGTVIIFLIFGTRLMGFVSNPIILSLEFLWILGVIIWAAFGVVHEAEELAEMLGEPYGTLVLTLSIVIIEVALVAAVMLGSTAPPTLGRDTMFAVLMIVLNGVVGLGLLIGGIRHKEQNYNIQGAGAYLVVLLPLSVLALVLPNFTSSTQDGSLSTVQAVLIASFTIILYGTFLILQTGRHNEFFTPMPNPQDQPVEKDLAIINAQTINNEHPQQKTISRSTIAKHIFLLLLHIFPIVILSKTLGIILAIGLLRLDAPSELGGIIIAMIVFTPEGIASLRATTANELQRAVNLCLGAATSTMGLTVPVVLLIGVLIKQPVLLGLSGPNMIILALTLLLSIRTFSGKPTTMLEGCVHLIMFFVYLLLVFFP
ncbi:calcium:proton antiporter [Desulfovibrio litoralis]|uniref:Ca2+:H+ antiporter n=1 Tax=Desulfovibrio litoralis DSM 11393 TaxID=1121455 RepID=A0A1M7STH7_9BACT|nr:calcium:proton antiporter [Desulfovibrio litoralis]SHN61741.1 Ca2+:H+ antiporter [Desulfovibrio litoralis DSM 11393]